MERFGGTPLTMQNAAMDSQIENQFRTALLAANHAPTTVRERVGDLNRFERSTGIPAETATLTDLRDYLAAGARSGWRPEYMKRIRGSFRVFYSWMHAEGLRYDDPARALASISVPRDSSTKPVIDEQTLRAGYAVASTLAVQLILALAATPGLRRTEIASLPLSARQDRLLRVQGKGGVIRELSLDDHTFLLLQERETELGWQPWYFPGRFTGHVHPATIAKWVRPYIAPCPLHSLRRRAGTNGHRQTRDICAVQHMLGHASLETTQRYVQTTPDEIARVIIANSLGRTEQTTPCDCHQAPTTLFQLEQHDFMPGAMLNMREM